jgi:hypothetical protein
MTVSTYFDSVTDKIGDDLTKSERITDEEIRNVRLDGVHQVEATLSSLDGESLEDTEDGRSTTERNRLDSHSTCFNLRNVENIVNDEEQRVGEV